jgi:hypothetical protein
VSQFAIRFHFSEMKAGDCHLFHVRAAANRGAEPQTGSLAGGEQGGTPRPARQIMLMQLVLRRIDRGDVVNKT